MNSCLYECTVMHHRLVPRKHAFHYRIFFFSLDLDEIDTAARKSVDSAATDLISIHSGMMIISNRHPFQLNKN